MRKRNKEYQEVLNRLTYCEPSQVGIILKEYFALKKTKKLFVAEKYIELKGDVRSMRLYVPQDDMEFVRGYIMNRVPPEALGF